MNLFKAGLEETGCFSSLFLDYLKGKEFLKQFYSYYPSLENIGEAIKGRAFPEKKRSVLVEELSRQYKGLEISDKVSANIESLKDSNTFTVTTGHQINLATGPLFFVYKILTAVNLAEELTEKYPNYKFVPVYWMATEDHDFEEISHFNLYGKNYEWETKQEGAVGRFSTDGIDEVLAQLPEQIDLLNKAYTQNSTLADATRYLVNSLFGKYGLVILDPDSRALKNEFKEVVKEELVSSKVAEAAEKTTKTLESEGYSAQVFLRDINLFLLNNGRKRLTRDGDKILAHPDESYSEEELLKILEDEPEKFSPNVVTRPLYQEFILPNLVYMGGPAEIVYWLQLKGVFDSYNVPFPVLLPRNFFLFIKKALKRKIDKADLKPTDFFKSYNELKEDYLKKFSEHEVDLSDENAKLFEFFDAVKNKAGEVDKSLEGFVMAERKKAIKQLDGISKRIKKAEEKKHEVSLGQIDNVKSKLFPEGSLQERKENLFTFYSNNPDFIEEIKACTGPFDFSFKILVEA